MKDCPGEPQATFLPCPVAELPKGEGRIEDLQAGGKERGLGEAGRLFLHVAVRDLHS